jgi:hypothetical protein
MVSAIERVSFLDRKDVVGFLNDTQQLVGPCRRAAKLAGIDVGQVVADRAAANGPFHFEDGFGNLLRIRGIHLQHEECETLRGFCPDAGKLFELFNEPVYGLRDIHALEQSGNFHPAGETA